MPGGRPTKDPKTHLIALRLQSRLLHFVEQLAAERKVTTSEALRRLVQERADGDSLLAGDIRSGGPFDELMETIVHNVGNWERLSRDLVEVPEGLAQHARDLSAKFALVGFFPTAPRAEIERARRLMETVWKHDPQLVRKGLPKGPNQVVLRKPPRRMKAWQGALIRIRQSGWTTDPNKDAFNAVRGCLDRLVNRSGLKATRVPEPFRVAWRRIAKAKGIDDVSDDSVRAQIESAMVRTKIRITLGKGGGRGDARHMSPWGWLHEFAECFGVAMPESTYAADRKRKPRAGRRSAS